MYLNVFNATKLNLIFLISPKKESSVS